MSLKRLFVAACALAALPAALAADGAMLLPARPLRTLPDCWVEHTQVQPSTVFAAGHEHTVASRKIHLMTDRHLGAEHPGDRRTRPCGVLAPRQSTAGAAAAKIR